MQSGKSFARGIRNFGLWILEFNFWNPELGREIRNPAAIKIGNPSSTDKESGIQYVESRIHSVNPGSKTFLDYLVWGEMKKHSSWDAYSAAHAPDRADFKSIHSFVRNHSLLKEGNVLVNPSNSTLNMLFSCRSSVSYFDYRSRRPQINMGNSI